MLLVPIKTQMKPRPNEGNYDLATDLHKSWISLWCVWLSAVSLHCLLLYPQFHFLHFLFFDGFIAG